MTIRKPILAGTFDAFTEINLPCIVTPKLDGFRCLKIDDKVLSRSLKPIRNIFIRETLNDVIPNGMDGELMLRDDSTHFTERASAFAKAGGEPDYIFCVFDYVKEDSKKPYNDRLKDLEDWFKDNRSNKVKMVPSKLITTYQDLEDTYNEYVAAGHEGIMTRSLDGRYKFGRSTEIEQILMKKKPWIDAEAILIDFVEEMTNINAKEINELGLTKRSSKKAGKVPGNTLGKFVAFDPVNFPDIHIEIGTGIGLTNELKKLIFDNQKDYFHKIIKYKFQFEGTKDKPRCPSFQGFRDLDDMDADHPIREFLTQKDKPFITAANAINESEVLEDFFK